MSRLTDLVRAAKQLDPELGRDLEAEIVPLQKRLPFGLNFERHAPEAVELAGHATRMGSKVRILPPRGSGERGDQRLWQVTSVEGDAATVALLDASEEATRQVALSDLILVAEFRERIYPGLRSDGAIESGGDRPFHTVINGENFHVLELLTFTHESAVDAIYIDPPYNSGASDWKYNNDYVENDDLYRHSKWLAFMERRLKLARRLLKPEDSVLIVTIDEKEYLRLGLLLEQMFPEATIQMVSSVINPKGASRGTGFRRTDEYLFFVMIGESTPARIQLGPEWSSSAVGANVVVNDDPEELEAPEWTSMMRRGSHSSRSDRPELFFPVYAAPDGSRIVEVGEAVPIGAPLPPEREGATTIWPRRTDGSDGRWQVGPTELRKRIEQGRVRLGRPTPYGFVINYLPDGAYAAVLSERFEITGRAADGSIVAVGRRDTRRVAPSQWKIASHNASENGTALLSALLPGRVFPFPKSLYAVEDSIRFFVADKPGAVVLDFFAGSGTTTHAVMRLNAQDGGRRQCISVTNNEVSADEQSKLRQMGLRPGDPEWERWGICDYITKPRIRAAISGSTPTGQPIKGDYRFKDEFPMADGFDENAAFFTLMYESPWRVSTDRAFAAIAPMLWLRAGAQGLLIEEISNGWAVAETYAIINDLDRSAEFVAAVNEAADVRVAYIVTDDEGRYQQVADEIRSINTVRLYEDYLRNCESTGDF